MVGLLSFRWGLRPTAGVGGCEAIGCLQDGGFLYDSLVRAGMGRILGARCWSFLGVWQWKQSHRQARFWMQRELGVVLYFHLFLKLVLRLRGDGERKTSGYCVVL